MSNYCKACKHYSYSATEASYVVCCNKHGMILIEEKPCEDFEEEY